MKRHAPATKISATLNTQSPLARIEQQMVHLPPFADLVRENQTMVYSLAYHSLGDRAAAEELAQDVFLSLYQHLGRLDSEAHVRHWLRQVTTRRCIDEARKRKLRPRLHLDEAPEPFVEAAPPDPLLQEQLRRELANLPPHARAVVVLRYQEEMEPTEIAALLQLPVNTIKTRLHRALKLLRDRMVGTIPGVMTG